MTEKPCISREQISAPLSLLELDTPGFHALVIRLDSHGDTKTDGIEERLTQAENAVARAAVSGLSNRAIAKVRGSSPRTVAVQLRSIYRKLDISSRTELAAVIDMVTQGVCS